MPVISAGQPTVSVALPVPTPVQSKPKPPVQFRAPAPTPQPQVGPSGVPPTPTPAPNLSAIILPWGGVDKPVRTGKNTPSQLRRRRVMVVKYSANDHAAFHEAINEGSGDTTARKVYADYLDENPGSAEPWVVHMLRHHDGPLSVRTGENGKPTLNFTKVVNPGVVNRRGLPTTIRYNDGRLSITGSTGQSIMQFREYDPQGHLSIRDVKPRRGWTPKMIRGLHDVWDRWHLNDMKAGSPAQEEHLRGIRTEFPGYPTSHYEWARERLAAAGLNPDPANNYNYGSAWRREEVPSDVLHFIAKLPPPEQPRPRPTPKPTPLSRRRAVVTGPKRFVRQPVDPSAHPEFQQWMTRVRGGNLRDRTANGVAADWVRDVTGDPDDIRAFVLQHHEPDEYGRHDHAGTGTPAYTVDGSYGGNGFSPRLMGGRQVGSGVSFVVHRDAKTKKPSHVKVSWSVPTGGRGRVGLTARASLDDLVRWVNKLPDRERKLWSDYAARFGVQT